MTENPSLSAVHKKLHHMVFHMENHMVLLNHMSRRKKENESIRKLQHTNGSYHVSLPIELIRQFKWKERQKVVVKQYGKDTIIIKDWSR